MKFVLPNPEVSDKPVADPASDSVFVVEKSNALESKSALESVIVAVVVAILFFYNSFVNCFIVICYL